MSPIANTGSTQTGAPATTATNKTDPLANESTFLTLLVSQLKNQDPLSPTDSNTFVSQLTSYSQLEQLIGINKNTTPEASSASNTASTTNPASTIPSTPSTSTPSTTGTQN